MCSDTVVFALFAAVIVALALASMLWSTNRELAVLKRNNAGLEARIRRAESRAPGIN